MLLRSRLTAPGLYLLDEPESPLSPTNQIALLVLLLEAAKHGSQIIAATHSPILMALPGATVVDFDQHPPAPIAWDDAEHVSITKAFLANPDAVLRHSCPTAISCSAYEQRAYRRSVAGVIMAANRR